MAFVRRLTEKDKEELVQLVLEVHNNDPSRLRNMLPHVADLLEGLAPQELIRRGNDSPFGLTERERNFHKEALDSISRRSKSLTPEEAIKGLEHGANLLVDDFTPGYPPRQELLRLVRKATGIQPRKTGKPVEKVIRGGESSRSVPVVRGIDLHLTWEFQLVRVTMNPNQWRLRSQALSIIGIGNETATDGAENHDAYLMDTFQNG